MRLVAALLAVVLLACGCGTVGESRRTPEARTAPGGVETWDLTGSPSLAAFDLGKDERAAIYETNDPRMVHYRLPGGRVLEVETRFIDFTHTTGVGGAYAWSLRTPEMTAPELVEELHGVLDQLGLPGTAADELARRVAAAPDDSFERIIVSSEPTVLDGRMRIGASATISPSAGKGRIDVGAVWR